MEQEIYSMLTHEEEHGKQLLEKVSNHKLTEGQEEVHRGE